jgi:hypothetical protein
LKASKGVRAILTVLHKRSMSRSHRQLLERLGRFYIGTKDINIYRAKRCDWREGESVGGKKERV